MIVSGFLPKKLNLGYTNARNRFSTLKIGLPMGLNFVTQKCCFGVQREEKIFRNIRNKFRNIPE